MFFKKQKSNVWPIIIVVCLTLVMATAGFAYWLVTRHVWTEILTSPLIMNNIDAQDQDVLAVLPRILGFDRPRTILLLFQNNTELRPSGGFIGFYAVVRVNKGQPEILTAEGTEALDRRTPGNWRPTPPTPISQYLGVDRWYFRDSNWSPDFPTSMEQTLAFYRAEGGIAADDIDTVIAITPTVLEKILALTGPMTVDGETFTTDNVTEKIEYNVEYGFADKGIAWENRKQILQPFMHAVANALANNLLRDFKADIAAAKTLLAERHILLYSHDKQLQPVIDRHEWSGRMNTTTLDYLLWADANLAALKTDHAMERKLNYSVAPNDTGALVATASMTYHHLGGFDWRTTRYLTYARIYAPLGSTFVSVTGTKRNGQAITAADVASGEENGRQWFGVYFSIEPGQTKTLSVTYRLPDTIRQAVAAGAYQLFIEKQSGTLGHGLTLDVNFGKTITSATPAEAPEKWHDSTYSLATDLRVDRYFEVKF